MSDVGDSEITRLAELEGLPLFPGEAAQLGGMVNAIAAAADHVAGLDPPDFDPRSPVRNPGRRPTREEDLAAPPRRPGGQALRLPISVPA
jgi:hypothetical protein